MRAFFYLRMALQNLRNNQNSYLPYLLSCSSIIGLYYMLDAITQNSGAGSFEGAATMSAILVLATVIAGIVSVLIVFYTNSFLVKRRKKELGLYSVLGMEKRHVARVLFCETSVTGGASLLFGLGGGILLGKLLFLILLNLLHIPATIPFFIPGSSILRTLLLFGGCFLLAMLYNFRQIRLANPIALLQGGRQGEREPKTKRMMALCGALTLGGGYALALLVRTPSDALTAFFPAVLLVIIGTYLLFAAGSIALLKFLRGRKSFYYRPQNFITVSGMLYRMKQNAVGLANICILSTCVLVTLSGTVCFYFGQEDTLRARFPRDVMLETAYTDGVREDVAAVLSAGAAQYGVEMKDRIDYPALSFTSLKEGDSFRADIPNLFNGALYAAEVMIIDDYNRLEDQGKRLNPGEVLLYMDEGTLTEDAIAFGGLSLRVRERIPKPKIMNRLDVTHTLLAVAPDLDTLRAIQLALYGEDARDRPVSYNCHFNLSGNENQKLAFVDALRPALKERTAQAVAVDNVFSSRQNFYTMYGSLVFIGVFFVLLFAIATVLIIYYKQVSEGYDDRERFAIMQQVGLSRREARHAIQKQVLLVFFLPLSVAVIHIAVAFPVLCKLVKVFNMTNIPLFLLCTVGSIFFFAVVYWAVYRATAGVYYKICRINRADSESIRQKDTLPL